MSGAEGGQTGTGGWHHSAQRSSHGKDQQWPDFMFDLRGKARTAESARPGCKFWFSPILSVWP